MARSGLLRHRKFSRLARLLEPHCPCGAEPMAAGVLELLWDGAYQAADDFVGDDLDVDVRCRWRGPEGVLAPALLEAGFLDHCADGRTGYAIHDLWDHAPDFVKKRATREAERRAQGRTISDVRREAVAVRWANQRAKLAANGIQLDTSVSHLQTGSLQKSLLGGVGRREEDLPPIVPQGGPTGSSEPPVKKPGRKRKSQRFVDDAALAPDELRLVDYWREQCQRPSARLVALDLERLRQGIADCGALSPEYGNEKPLRLAALAIRGCASSPHHMGENETGAKYTDLSLIFRDPKHIRQFVDIAKARAEGRVKAAAAPPEEPPPTLNRREARP